jgi:chromosome segregation ATPase
MEIVLVVAVLIVAAVVLYVAITLGPRTRQNIAPLIDEAVNDIYGRIEDLKGQLNAFASEMTQDRDQTRLEDRKIQGRLDHADSRMNSIANRLLTELEAIKHLIEQVDTHQGG